MNGKKLKAILGFYRINRLAFDLIFAVVIMITFARGIPESNYLALGPLLFALGLCSVVGINNIKDVVADRVSKKGEMKSYNPLATDIFTVRQAWLAALLPLGLGIIIAVLWTNREIFILFVLFIVFSILYDVYGKRLVIAPFIPPACMALFIVLLGIMMNKETDSVFAYQVLLFFIFMVEGQLAADILDYEGDKAAGYRRLTVVYGPMKGAYLAIVSSIILLLLAVAAFFHLHFSWISFPLIAFAGLQIILLSKAFKSYAQNITILNARKVLLGLTFQYSVLMLAFILGLRIVGG